MARTITHLEIQSTSFQNGARIPVRHTRDGENAAPALSWSGVPEETKSLALICDDPDAPTPKPFVHWVLYNIPPNATSVPARGAVEGLNDFGERGYDGPEPPKGHGTHHYHFRLLALDTMIEPKEGMKKDELLRAMKGHVLGEGEIVGTYLR